MPLSTHRTSSSIRISNGFWQTTHSAKNGYAITGIQFANGKLGNILRLPMACYFSEYAARDWHYPCFSEEYDHQAAASLESCPEKTILTTQGSLRDREGKSCGISCRCSYIYSPYHIKIIRRFKVDSNLRFNSVGINRIDVSPELNCFGVSPMFTGMGGKDLSTYEASSGANVCRWGTVERAYYPSSISFDPATYLCVFKKGGEGIETFIGDNIEEWTSQFSKSPHSSRYAIGFNQSPERVSVIMEPLFTFETGSVKLSGDYQFSSYIALPNIPSAPMDRRKAWVGNVLRWRSKDQLWATKREIRQMAADGVRVIVHHHDSPSGHGIVPDGSFFWPDGKYPPYSATHMRQLDQIINWTHEAGMQIVPYFCPRLFHPHAPLFKQQAKEWARHFRGKAAMTYCPASASFLQAGKGVFGAIMCLKSGWSDYMKSYIATVLENHPFDGAYFDGLNSVYCFNRRHAPYLHTETDEMLDLVGATRKLIGSNGIIIAHQTAVPRVAMENMCDVVVMGENVAYYPNYHRGLPGLDGYESHLEFMGVIPRSVCAYTMIPPNAPAAETQKVLLHALLKGFGFYWFGYEHWRRATRELHQYPIQNMRFYPHGESPVETDQPEIKSAAYVSSQMACAILANFSHRRQAFRWRLNLNTPQPFADKTWKKECLKPFDYKIISVKAAASAVA
ncbi:MAG: DUF6259 domain-containing protein [Verrucomicrobiae bacterium]|nr:DUF6259 domain-containing protein [Verrucomicrobiae bacterium]